MKQAVILVGSHFSGKSKTINLYLKALLGISVKDHIFSIDGKDGFVLSQSFEEAERDVDYVLEKYGAYHYLVLAAPPKNEHDSNLGEASQKLSEVGFVVHTVIINANEGDSYYERKADEIFTYLHG